MSVRSLRRPRCLIPRFDGAPLYYARGCGETAGEGSIKASFAGEHCWFWRNRDDVPVTVTLHLRGAYAEVSETY